jgi:hypothetical protein
MDPSQLPFVGVLQGVKNIYYFYCYCKMLPFDCTALNRGYTPFTTTTTTTLLLLLLHCAVSVIDLVAVDSAHR